MDCSETAALLTVTALAASLFIDRSRPVSIKGFLFDGSRGEEQMEIRCIDIAIGNHRIIGKMGECSG
jgi:hypothetical protein